jgi:tetratricopeptide (TPR) repeat protein
MTMIRRFGLAAISLLAVPVVMGQIKDPDLKSLMDAGHFKRAAQLIVPRLRNPKDAEALYFSAQLKEKSGDIDAAIAQAEQAVSLDPGKSAYHELLCELYGTKAQRVSMFSAMKFAHKIREEGEKALQLDPKSSDAYELLIQFYLQAPGIAGGDKNKAYQMLDKLLQLDPVRANLIRGESAVNEKQEAKAEDYYNNAVLADANSYSAHTALANWYLSKKKYDLAEKNSRDLLRIDRGRAAGYVFLAIQFALQERWRELDAILADAEKNVPDDLGYFYQAGRVLWAGGKELPRAEKYFKKYLSQEPEIGAPALAHAHWRLGLVYEKEGRKPEAIQEVQMAVNMKPDLEAAKKDLKRLK